MTGTPICCFGSLSEATDAASQRPAAGRIHQTVLSYRLDEGLQLVHVYVCVQMVRHSCTVHGSQEH